MILTDSLYVGIDPTSGRKDFSYVALDANLNLVDRADVDMENMLAFLDGQKSVVVAINAPARVNHGLVKKKLEDESVSPQRTFRGVDIRLSEYELRGRGITVTGTPSREEFCPAWMQVGFGLYQKLSKMGFKSYGEEGATN